jgi:hypothetical protein
MRPKSNRLLALLLPLALAALFVAPASAQNAAGAQPAKPPQPIPSPSAPATAQHTTFIVTTNKKGQVVTVKGEVKDHDAAFNLMTYGNAVQMFIRTTDGRAIPGRYRVTYDYAPETKDVRRNVALIAADDADANAIGAVDRLAAVDRKNAERAKALRKAKGSQATAKPAAR